MGLRGASLEDLKDLQELYFSVYGNTYPLPLGQDPKVMAAILSRPENIWLVYEENNKLIASCVFEVEEHYGIGRVSGLVVHPEFRRAGIARELIHTGMEQLFSRPHMRSAYATTRTLDLAPQITFLREAFVPVGISPNAHKLESFETLVLMAAFNKNVSFQRSTAIELPIELKSLVEITKINFPSWSYSEITYVEDSGETSQKLKDCRQSELTSYEVIYSPNFVYNRFKNTFHEPWERFYPFHKPNMLIISEDQKIEIYAHFSPKDGYCTVITYNTELEELEGRLKKLFSQLKDLGVKYIEILMRLDDISGIQGLLRSRFLPSGLYPGMLSIQDFEQDVVLMSRSLEPLDFHSVKLANCFQPFLEQYVQHWKKKFLDSLKFENFKVKEDPRSVEYTQSRRTEKSI